jgi:hypothetical protein
LENKAFDADDPHEGPLVTRKWHLESMLQWACKLAFGSGGEVRQSLRCPSDETDDETLQGERIDPFSLLKPSLLIDSLALRYLSSVFHTAMSAKIGFMSGRLSIQ